MTASQGLAGLDETADVFAGPRPASRIDLGSQLIEASIPVDMQPLSLPRSRAQLLAQRYLPRFLRRFVTWRFCFRFAASLS